MLLVNEQPVAFEPGIRLADLAGRLKPDADLFVVNGFPVPAETVAADGDHCWLIRRGEVPPADEIDRLLHARHSPGVHERVRRACVGIMGLGGLGSTVVLALARIGVGKLLLADYDVVEPTNLNRQHYFVDQIGMRKTAALRDTLHRVHPYVRIETIDERLTEENIPAIFAEVEVLVECFDDPAMKASGLRAALTGLPEVGYVTASGVAGYGDNNIIRTTRLQPRVYLVGDGCAAAGPGQGLMAPRVGIAAHHQANQVLRLLLGVAD